MRYNYSPDITARDSFEEASFIATREVFDLIICDSHRLPSNEAVQVMLEKLNKETPIIYFSNDSRNSAEISCMHNQDNFIIVEDRNILGKMIRTKINQELMKKHLKILST